MNMVAAQYSKAPITEALAQINFQIVDDRWARVEKWATSLGAEKIEDIFQIQIPASGEVTKSVFGKRLHLSKEHLNIQVTRDFLAVSQVGGYRDWDSFSAKWKSYFKGFFSVCDVANVSRAALRYINQFDFDASESPKSLLTQLTHHPIGSGFENRVTTLASTYGISRSSAEAVVQQSIELRTAVSKWVVTLDIDVFMNKPIKADISQVESEMEHLRKYKNQIFESLLTEVCRERFK